MSSNRRSSSSSSSSSSSPSSSYISNGMPHEEDHPPQQTLVRQRAALPTPATHAYLGEATIASTLSRKDLEVGSTVEMPILSLPGVVLFPGESLPLRLQNPAYAALAESMLGGGRGGGGGQGQAARHLGVVNRLSSRSAGLLVRTSPVGTTAEIRSGHGGSVGEDAEAAGLAVMARGRHRFRLLEDLGWRRGVRYWKVVISPDLCPGPLRAPLPRAFRDTRGSRHWAMAIPRFVVDSNSPVGLAMRAACLLRKQRGPESPMEAAAPAANAGAGSLRQASLPDRTEASVSSGDRDGDDERSGGDGNDGIPAEDSMSFDGEILGKEEEEEEEWMSGGNGRGKVNPTLFSFWLAANLPLDDDARQELLILDSVVMRLRLEIKHLELSRRRPLCCAGCGTGVAWEGDVFTLPGAEGVVGAYVNADGYVHQTVTVRDARNLALMDEPELRDTWFPGYGWIPAYCAGCLNHLGWRFVAVDQGSNAASITQPVTSAPSRSRGGTTGGGSQAVGAAEELGPPSFYGLRRPALTLR